MDDLLSFLDEFPALPPIRGNKHTSTYIVSQDEWDAITEVVYHPVFRDNFHNHVSEYIRWLLYYATPHMAQIAGDKRFMSLGRKLRKNLRVANLQIAEDTVEDYVDAQARELMLVLESDLPSHAMRQYTETIRFIREQPVPWDVVVGKKFREHQLIQELRERLMEIDPEGIRAAEEE